jgi:RNA polymerase sigma factor (sigma-70 family)
MPESDDRLFARWCRGGDAEALGALFDATAPRLLRLAIHLVGDAAEAEDLVQATFLTALEQRASVDPTRPVMPWLTGVLAHKAQQHRRRAARVPDPERLAGRAVEDPSAPLERRELDGEVARAVDGLGEPYRQVLLLRLRHGMELADIAHVLERDPGTVRVQLHRGLEKLRAALPAALASLVAIAWTAPRGLDALRAQVLGHAAATAAAVPSSLIVGGALVSKKVVFSAAVVLALASLGLWRALASEPTPAGRPVVAAEELARAPSLPAALIPPAPAAVPSAPLREFVREATPSAAPRTAAVVVDAETQRPIAGASVRLFAPRRALAPELLRAAPELYENGLRGGIEVRMQADWPRLVGASGAARLGREPLIALDRPRAGESELASTRSAADGSYALELGTRDGLIEVASPGYATRWCPLSAGDEAPRLELWRERTVRGVVRVWSSSPPTVPIELALSGFVLPRPVLQAPTSAPDDDPGPIAGTPIPPNRIQGLGAWLVRPDAEGRFELRVGAPKLTVECLTPGWSQRMSQTYDSTREVEVHLYAQPTFHVFDAASGEPVEDVRLLGRELSNRYVRWAGTYFAPGGRLTLPGNLDYATSMGNALEFHVWSEGFAPALVSIPDVRQARTIDVPLERGEPGVLAGRVLRAGAPLAGAEVALLGRSPLQWRFDEDTLVDAVLCAADGRFRLEAPPGSYILRVRGDTKPFSEEVTLPDRPGTMFTQVIPGREPYFEAVELPARGECVVDLARGAVIEVEIVDRLGRPQVEHDVVLGAGDGRQQWAFTDARGLARYANLPAGTYKIGTPRSSVHGGSFSNGLEQKVELAAAATERVRFELPSDGTPVHVRVVARDVTDYSGWRARFDHDDWGELAADGTVPAELRAGGFQLEVLAVDGRHWHVPAPREARDGDVVELELGTGRYHGVLLRSNGEPWPGVAVYAAEHRHAENGTWLVSCVTDAAGAFELTSLGAEAPRLRFQTDLERGPWGDGGNDLAGFQFAPAAPPGEGGTWLSLRAPDRRRVRITGSVSDAAGARVAGARIFSEGESPEADGRWLAWGRQGVTHTDSQGAFELDLPRAARVTLRISLGEEREAALTRTLEVTGESETVALSLPPR